MHSQPTVSKTGEEIWEGLAIGRTPGVGRTSSVALVRLKKGCSSQQHYHKKTTEWYVIMEGHPWLKINDQRKKQLQPGSVVAITPNERHEIWNEYSKAVLFYVVSSPAWNKSDEYLPE